MKFLIILHDIGHYSYFSTIPVNRFFGAIIGVYIWNPFDSWRMIHNTHHKYFGNIDA
jgi:omega-6 fatty acid desaturase (delta-12 desaturase)